MHYFMNYCLNNLTSYFFVVIAEMKRNDETPIGNRKQSTAKISEDRNQARRARDRARRNGLTAEEKEEINAHRRAISHPANQARRERDRARRNNLTAKQKEEINARRRAAPKPTSTQRKTEEEKAARLARRRENVAARRNTPCAQSIAMQCPNAATLPMLNLASSRHRSTTREGTSSPPPSTSTSMPDYTIRTDGNKTIFTHFIYLCHGVFNDPTYQIENVVGDMEAILSGIMDENNIPDDLMDKECYIYGREGTCATLSNAPLRYESI
jgi:hypothetical protein